MANRRGPDPDMVASEAAKAFSDAFYNALQSSPKSLPRFYCTPSPTTSAGPIPRILWNGHTIPDPTAMTSLFETTLPECFFEIQTLNAHVLNPRHYPELSNSTNISIAVMVGGYLRLENEKAGPLNEFSESFVLVPNKAKLMGKGGDAERQKRDWLIQQECFRFVVSHDPIERAGWTQDDSMDGVV